MSKAFLLLIFTKRKNGDKYCTVGDSYLCLQLLWKQVWTVLKTFLGSPFLLCFILFSWDGSLGVYKGHKSHSDFVNILERAGVGTGFPDNRGIINFPKFNTLKISPK